MQLQNLNQTMLDFNLNVPDTNLALSFDHSQHEFSIEKVISTTNIFLEQAPTQLIHSGDFKLNGVIFEKLSNRTDLYAIDWKNLIDKFEEIKNNSIGLERIKQITKVLSAIEYSQVSFSSAIKNVNEIVKDIYAKDSRPRYDFVTEALENIVREVQASDLSNEAQDAILHAVDPIKFQKMYLDKYATLELMKDWDVIINLNLDHLDE